MTVYELIQVLSRYPAGTEVCLSQKPRGYVVPILYHDGEDEILKLYGDGSLTPEGNETL